MMKVAGATLIVGIAVLIVSAGTLFLTQSRLDDLPANPVNQLLIAEKENLKEVEVLSRNGIIAGAAMAGISGLTLGWIVFRGR